MLPRGCLALGVALAGVPVPPPADRAPARRVWVLRSPEQSAATPYVGVIGDSTGSQLAFALAPELHRRDIAVVIATVGGCQPTDVAFTYQSPEYFRSHRH